MASASSVHVVFDTSLGRIVAELFTERAPITAGNFLRYVDERRYESASFYRATRPDNGGQSTIRIIQGGLGPECEFTPPLPPIEHESTKVTGLSHVDGALSAARRTLGTAASEFFIVLGDTPRLDFGGSPKTDLQGYAVFGRVVEGMDLVRQINASPTGTNSSIGFMKGQALIPPVAMRIARRRR